MNRYKLDVIHKFIGEHERYDTMAQGLICRSLGLRPECNKENNCKTIPVNPSGSRIIYVFHGYKVSDNSYQALYHQAEISGVSGDNSLEMGLSAQSLTYYHSTNADNKKQTLITLKKIIEKVIPLPDNLPFAQIFMRFHLFL